MEAVRIDLLQLAVGCRVRLSNLSRADLNGVSGDVLGFAGTSDCSAEDARWVVRKSDGADVKVRARNLTVVGGWPRMLPHVPLLLEGGADERAAAYRAVAEPFGLAMVSALDLAEHRRELTAAHVALISASAERLEALRLDGCVAAIDDQSVVHLTALPALRTLSLRGCTRLGDDGVDGLAAGLDLLPEECAEVRTGERARGLFAALAVAMGGARRPLRLTTLCLADCAALTDRAVVRLAEGCPGLTAVDLSGCAGVSDRGVGALARHGALVALALSRCPRVTDTGVCALARACPVHALRLASSSPEAVLSGVTPFALRALAENRGASLTALDLGGQPQLAADAVLRALCGRCPRLQRLRLTGCERLTGRTLREALGVAAPGVATPGAATPGAGAATPGVADAAEQRQQGQPPGGGLPSLVALGVGGCPLVGDEDREALCRARPDLELSSADEWTDALWDAMVATG